MSVSAANFGVPASHVLFGATRSKLAAGDYGLPRNGKGFLPETPVEEGRRYEQLSAPILLPLLMYCLALASDRIPRTPTDI